MFSEQGFHDASSSRTTRLRRREQRVEVEVKHLPTNEPAPIGVAIRTVGLMSGQYLWLSMNEVEAVQLADALMALATKLTALVAA